MASCIHLEEYATADPPARTPQGCEESLTAPLPDRVHHRPRPRSRVLAVSTHPQASPTEHRHPDRTGSWHRRVGDPRRLPRAPRLPVHRPARPHDQAGVAVRRLRRRRRCDGGRGGGTQVAARPGLQPDQRHAALRARRTVRPPRAAVVVEDRYSQVFKLDRIRPAIVADGLAELQVRWPGVPIVFCETRQLAEEWTYHYLAAAHTWASTETAAIARIGPADAGSDLAEADPPEPTVGEPRAWARANGHTVPDRGRLRPEILAARRDATTS